jgi:SAM-dependent methyltransferase
VSWDGWNCIFRANAANRQRWVKDQLAVLAPGTTLLDIGSGGQPYRKYCGHLVYKAHDFGQLDAPSQIIEGQYGSLDYISDIAHIPVTDAAFDAILCTEVLEHVPNPIAAVTEMGRLLRPGGKLILTAPLGAFLHQKPYHFYGGYTPFWHRKYLAEAGFINIMVQPNGGFFRFFGQECQRIPRLLFRGRSFGSPWRWLLLPLELLCSLVLTILCPIVCHCLDTLVPTEDCTIGYHVTAEKK